MNLRTLLDSAAVKKRTAEITSALRQIDDHPSVRSLIEEAQAVQRVRVDLSQQLRQLSSESESAEKQMCAALDCAPLDKLKEPLANSDLVTRNFEQEGAEIQRRLMAAERRQERADGAVEEARAERRQLLLREAALLHLELQRRTVTALQAAATFDQERLDSEREIRSAGGAFHYVFISGLHPMGISLERLAYEGKSFSERLEGQAREVELFYPPLSETAGSSLHKAGTEMGIEWPTGKEARGAISMPGAAGLEGEGYPEAVPNSKSSQPKAIAPAN